MSAAVEKSGRGLGGNLESEERAALAFDETLNIFDK
jgi:hypothetical protein